MKKDRGTRGRWNAGDTLLVVLALLSVTGIMLRFFFLRLPTGSEVREYEIVARWANVDARTLSCVKEGDMLYTPAGEPFGKVVSISSEAAEITVTEGGLTYRVSAPDETRRDALITVLVSGHYSDGAFFRDGKRILGQGESYQLYSERAELTLRIVRMPTDS